MAEAVTRPTMRVVPVTSVAQHVLQAPAPGAGAADEGTVRAPLNAARRLPREEGIIVPQGAATLRQQVREQWRTEDATLSRRAWRYASRC